MNGGKSRVTFLVSIALCYFDDLLARTFLYSGTLCPMFVVVGQVSISSIYIFLGNLVFSNLM